MMKFGIFPSRERSSPSFAARWAVPRCWVLPCVGAWTEVPSWSMEVSQNGGTHCPTSSHHISSSIFFVHKLSYTIHLEANSLYGTYGKQETRWNYGKGLHRCGNSENLGKLFGKWERQRRVFLPSPSGGSLSPRKWRLLVARDLRCWSFDHFQTHMIRIRYIRFLPSYLLTYLHTYLITYQSYLILSYYPILSYPMLSQYQMSLCLPMQLCQHLSIYTSTVSIYLSIYLPTYLSICLSIYLSIYLFVYLSICLSIYLSISIYLYLSLSISIYLHLSPSISIYLHLSLSICLCLSLSISICLCLSLSVSVYLCLSLSISVYLYLSLSISIYLYLSLSISIYLYLSLSISISIYLYLSLSISIYLHLSLSVSIYLSNLI